MSTGRALSARVRGSVVGGSSTITAVAAHAAAHGMLPDTDVLVVVLAVGVAIGAAVTSSPRLPSLAVLAAGQGIVHGAMVALTGAHHDLLDPRMAMTHGIGALATLLLIAALSAVASSVVHIVVHVVASPPQRSTGTAVPRAHTSRPIRVPTVVALLGAIGLRAPPLPV